jgi:ubiquinone/menaquinone biosynthesis C-methylase UbiE
MTTSREQFGRVARAYATSAAHARGEDLALIRAQIGPGLRVVDVGTGAGHALAAIAKDQRLAVGVDATREMLEVARDVLRERGLDAGLVEADAAALPFADGAFDAAVSRLAAHHFPDVATAFREIARVLRPRGTFVFVDNYAPDDPQLDRWIDELERTRDASHVRSHTLEGWRRALDDAGFESRVPATMTTSLETDDWLARSQTPPAQAERARAMLRSASAEARETFRISETGFSLLKAVIVATRR